MVVRTTATIVGLHKKVSEKSTYAPSSLSSNCLQAACSKCHKTTLQELTTIELLSL